MNMNNKEKRKVGFNDVDEGNKKQRKTTTDTRLHSGKYTLDSDEEDEEEQEDNKEMNQDDLDG